MAITSSIGQPTSEERKWIEEGMTHLMACVANMMAGRLVADFRTLQFHRDRSLHRIDASTAYGSSVLDFVERGTGMPEFQIDGRFRPNPSAITSGEDNPFLVTHLPAEKRLAIAVLLDQPGADFALADYLQEIGVEPNGVAVERDRVLNLLKEGIAHHESMARDGSGSWQRGAVRALTNALAAVRRGDVDGEPPKNQGEVE